MSAGYHPTLPLPPLSTVYGLLAAAVGRDVDPSRVWLGYRFRSEAKARDLEKIILFSEKGATWDAKTGQVGSMPIQREFLLNPILWLYMPPLEELWQAFRYPRFPLVLGRSQDVAYVEKMERVTLEPATEGEAEGILLPFPCPGVASFVYNLPTFLPTHPPRRPLAVKPFQMVVQRQHVRYEEGLLYRVDDTVVPVYTIERLR